MSIEDVLRLPNVLATKSGIRFRIPIFFYEAAATRPDRVNLEMSARAIRGLARRVERKITIATRISANKVHPTAGVTVVGARKILIAYNVNLNTSDISIANRLQRRFAFRAADWRYVKSMGVELKARNLAQVSINLTDTSRRRCIAFMKW